MDRVIELLTRAGEAACAIDREQRLTFWNQAAERLLGYAAEEVLGKPCFTIVGLGDGNGCTPCRSGCEIFQQANASQPLAAQELEALAKDGRRMWLSMSSLRVPKQWHDASALIHLLRDITPAKTLESNLREMLDRLDEPRVGSFAPDVLPRNSTRCDELTPREREVLRQLATGRPTAELAQRLHISEATLRNHVHNILSKLGAHNRLEAVSVGIREGVI